eukprot:TRINITY_DN254_c0_g2_i1.p1 TRINITY_DN254_c0_g2~~TRINITY_DN254_c0_g2_i1.p1  ORF type:complete len:846 (+),score=325.91 TRINITY_DN254_c0_g2_i1:62-2539(+)
MIPLRQLCHPRIACVGRQQCGAHRVAMITKEELEAIEREKYRILVKAEDLINKTHTNKCAVGPYRVGKDMCEIFGLEHPPLKTAAKYMEVIRKHLPKLKQENPVPQAERQERASSNPSGLWESEMSCFKRGEPDGKLQTVNRKLHAKYANYMVVDFETTIKAAHKRKASPFDRDNRIVYTASVTPGGEAEVTGPFDTREGYADVFPDLTGVDCLVGHNIKFDLLYCWTNPQLRDFFRKGGVIWDTMYAEYVLNGHREMKLSLDALSLKYGGELKDEFIAQQWAQGIDTADINPDKIREYAAGDVRNTQLIFEKQLHVLSEGARLPLICSHMEGLLATTEMEYNGMYINARKAEDIAVTLEAEAEKMDEQLLGLIPEPIKQLNEELVGKLKDEDDVVTFNWTSAMQLRSYLFGGEVTYKRSTFNELKQRYLIQPYTVVFEGHIPQEWKERFQERYTTKGDAWKVSDEVLSNICDSFPEEEFTEGLQLLQAIKKKRKLLTYLHSFVDLRDIDGVVHPQLNHTITRTGRLSSANPNMQNVPRTGVKDCIESRFSNGVMVESDYSQLEVFVNALLSQDENLMSVLAEGADLHCKRLAAMKGMEYDEVVRLCKVVKDPDWIAWRTKAKVFSFQRQYGASIKTIATETKMSVEEVQKLADAEEKMFPQVKEYFDRVTAVLKDTAAETGGMDGFYDAPSGNRWYFSGSLRKSRSFKKQEVEFRRQLVLNHPVQGFAAEIVLTCLGRLWRKFIATGNFSETGDFTSPARALMVNTVHDCVWIDAQKEIVDQVAALIDATLCDVQTPYTENGFNIPLWMMFKTETHVGATMADI